MTDDRRVTDSGVELHDVYGPDDLAGGSRSPPRRARVVPVHARRRTRRCTAAACGRCASTPGWAPPTRRTARFRYLLEQGQTGLSVAFDLPTQMGLRLGSPARARARSARPGVAIDSLEDMRRLFDGIPLDEVTTSMTINATAPILLLLYELVAEEQGVAASTDRRHGPERHPEGVRGARHLHLPAAAVDAPHHRPVRVLRASGSRGGTRSRSAATTCARRARPPRRRSRSRSPNGIAYVQAALDAGLESTTFAPRLSFFFACHMHFFEEVAKFRAARRMWARIMRERFGAKDARSADAAVPHADRRARRSPRSSPRTTSCGPRSRRSRRCSAARSRCTRTRSTRRWRCPPSTRRRSRCAPSR